MSRLDQARRRLEVAVARLERAAQRSHARLAERAELAAALERARAEGKDLRELGTSLSTRLDSAIGRLKAAIEA
jgi:chromosome segregation ATPase